jgi:hypothetical protein
MKKKRKKQIEKVPELSKIIMEGKDIIENPQLIIIIRGTNTNLIEIGNKGIQEEIIEKEGIEITIKYNILHSINRFLQEKILKIISQIGLIDLN